MNTTNGNATAHKHPTQHKNTDKGDLPGPQCNSPSTSDLKLLNTSFQGILKRFTSRKSGITFQTRIVCFFFSEVQSHCH